MIPLSHSNFLTSRSDSRLGEDEEGRLEGVRVPY